MAQSRLVEFLAAQYTEEGLFAVAVALMTCLTQLRLDRRYRPVRGLLYLAHNEVKRS